MLAGDRLAVVGYKNADGEYEANQVLNLTTLMGKWRSIDKQFELMEDGTVLSAVKEEAHPWTSWKVFNGQLLLNKDTFTVNALGGDSLYFGERARHLHLHATKVIRPWNHLKCISWDVAARCQH